MMLNAEMTTVAASHSHPFRGAVARLRERLPHHRALSREEQIRRYQVLRDRDERDWRATMLASRII